MIKILDCLWLPREDDKSCGYIEGMLGLDMWKVVYRETGWEVFTKFVVECVLYEEVTIAE